MNFDKGATLADRYDQQTTKTQKLRTARTWMKLLSLAGLAALLSAFVEGGISMWIVAGTCFGSATLIGIANW